MGKIPASIDMEIDMKKKKPFVVLATPAYGGQCYVTYALSCQQWASYNERAGNKWHTLYIFNEALIQRGRNKLVYDFLTIPGATHLFFVDADISFNVPDYVKMLEADKDVVIGAYPKKRIRWDLVRDAALRGKQNLALHANEYVVDFVDGKHLEGEISMDKVFEVEHGGTGCMLIKREVFEKLEPHLGKYRNSWAKEDKEYHINYFDVQVDPKNDLLLSEDYYFCQKVREHGMKIWCAPWVELGHTGTHQFKGCFVDPDYL